MPPGLYDYDDPYFSGSGSEDYYDAYGSDDYYDDYYDDEMDDDMMYDELSVLQGPGARREGHLHGNAWGTAGPKEVHGQRPRAVLSLHLHTSFWW